MPLSRRTASRLEAILIVVAIALLIAVLPRRYHIMPVWFAYLGMFFIIAPMLLGIVIPDSAQWRRFERTAEFVAVGSALIFNVFNLLFAAYDLVENPGKLEPVRLFYTSIGIWVGNVLIFTLLYWLIDRGGPDARLNDEIKYPDFDFPAMDDDVHVPPGWKPGMVDYLFLGFTTSTAFSPTEAMPLTSRAKLLVILQSTIALVTIAIVAARTINILK
jgi:MFS family permease